MIFLQGPKTDPAATEKMRDAVKRQRGFNVEIVNYAKSGKDYWLAIEVRPIYNKQGQVTNFIAVESDISKRKEAESEKERLHLELQSASRQAGIAEMATGVLHNVGNVLNSVNVSADLVVEKIRRSSISKLGQATELLQKHADELGHFVTNHEQGRFFPQFLEKLYTRLESERLNIDEELQALVQNVEHINEIVATQQSNAKMSGVVQEVDITQLVEDAIRTGLQILDGKANPRRARNSTKSRSSTPIDIASCRFFSIYSPMRSTLAVTRARLNNAYACAPIGKMIR